MTNCSDTARIIYSTKDIITAYPTVVTNLYSILDIKVPCESSTSCPCSTFLFELNFLYYLYTLNQCLLNNGSINKSNFTNIDQQIMFTIETPGNLQNSTIKESQDQTTKVTTMNINDPNNQNQLGGFYYSIYQNLQNAFKSEGIKINTSLVGNTTISKETFITSFQEAVGNMMITNQILNITIKNDIFKSLTANLNQSTTINLLSEQLANNTLSNFFNKQVTVNIPKSCQQEPKSNTSKTTKTSKTTTSSKSSSDDKDHHVNLIKASIIIAMLVVIGIIIEIFIHKKRHMYTHS